MSTLPTRLQPLWPLAKRAHRLLSLLLGTCFRLAAPLLGPDAVPRTATARSADTAAREPAAVTLHPAGPAEHVERGVPEGLPAGHWRYADAARADLPERYLLEVRDGRLVGEFGATVTPGGTLDYQTSGYFGLSSWREHPLYLHPRLGRVEHVPGTVLSLTTRGTAENYYHFLYDAIGRYGIVEDALPTAGIDAVVVPHRAGYQRALLELAGIAGRLIEPRPDVTIRADRLLVPSTPNQDLDAPASTVAWLRGRLRPSGSTDTPRRLYLTRGDRPNTRRYVHEAQLWPWLERRGFTRVDPGRYSVQEQIDLFHGADVVIAPHGAGLANITFCRPGTRVLELFADTYVHLGLWAIAAAVGLDYHYLVGDGAPAARRPMTGVLTDVTVPVELVQGFVATTT